MVNSQRRYSASGGTLKYVGGVILTTNSHLVNGGVNIFTGECMERQQGQKPEVCWLHPWTHIRELVQIRRSRIESVPDIEKTYLSNLGTRNLNGRTILVQDAGGKCTGRSFALGSRDVNDIEPVQILWLVSNPSCPLDHLRNQNSIFGASGQPSSFYSGEVGLQRIQRINGILVCALYHATGWLAVA
ncbi:hypothetical protein OGAPHI_007219 [Ogataea philodendri]|uniref:Serine protease n=1 Tax=Ogataea philodendri TaxID=1378263 RepID=A0A9P8NVX8_9ASCO|nr:uncharacterized protein OGAPHI_007219 [Ogataea philodendri]KAH3660014.1 hypothetical protein OGAPHI_007219 [Ogataea philodendri]